jgi:hypothetical protein
MKDAYKAPVLQHLGRVSEITGTGCLDLDGDGDGKTFGYPSDTNWHFLPFTDCETGS